MIEMQLADAARTVQGALLGSDVAFLGCGTDSRKLHPGEMFIALRGERFDGHDFLEQARAGGACAALVEREGGAGDLPRLVVADTRSAMGRLAQAWRAGFNIPLIAITGSNGKTTVKEMVAAILSRRAPVLYTRGNLNNDIGVPLTLFGLGREHRYAVIEIGANHPGEIAPLSRMARPTVALITQCAPAHLEGFGSVAGVARAKAEIFEGLEMSGTAIINDDDEYAGSWRAASVGFRQISFGLSGRADVHARRLSQDHDSGHSSFLLVNGASEIEIRLPLPGRHNVANALAAAACCAALEIPPSEVKAGLESLQPVAGRLVVRRGAGGVRLLDDTYNANPGSLRAALEVLRGCPGRHWLVLGDMGELGADAQRLHYQAGEMARDYGVERIAALGPLSAHAVRGFGAGASHYEDAAVLLEDLLPGLDADLNILVKGSRVMHMERIVNGLLGDH